MKYSYEELVDVIRENNIELPKSYNLIIRVDEYSESPRKWSPKGKIYTTRTRHFKSEIEFESDFELHSVRENYYVFPISVYNHSGISIYIGQPCCRWDSAVYGQYLIKKSDVSSFEEAESIAKREIEEYNKWYNNEVFQFEIEDEFGEMIDSCGGFYDLELLKEYLPDEPSFTEEEISKAWENRYQ